MNSIFVNREIIREYVGKFDKEIGIIGGIIYGNSHPENDHAYEDYMEFYDELSFDEKMGNMYVNLDIPFAMEMIQDIINGNISFEDAISGSDRKFKKQFKKKMKES